MSYVDLTRDVLRAELAANGNDVPDELLDLYALLAFVKGTQTRWVDVHDAWALWTRNTRPDHRSLVPYWMLADEVKALDEPYWRAIIATVERLENPLPPDPPPNSHRDPSSI